MKKLYAPLTAFLLPLTFFAQSTGFLPPTATALPNGFTNASNAFVSDDVWASVAHQSGCRCPWLYLSYNGGTNYTSSQLLGPFGTTDQTSVAGSPTFTWGRTWTYTEFTNANFRLKIANPSASIEQGYSNFNFVIPNNATINGIEVRLEWHGDANFTMEFLDLAEVNVHYTATTSNGDTYSASQTVNIFPNPAHDLVSFHFNSEKPSSISILNLQGQVVLERSASSLSSSNTLDLDLSSLPRGIYFIRVISDNGIRNEKIVLE